MATKKNPYIVEGGLEVREGTIRVPSGVSNQRPTATASGEFWTNTSTKNTEVSYGTEFRAIEFQDQWVNIATDTIIPAKPKLAYLVNTTAGPVEVQLPTIPVDKQSIVFVDMKGTFKTNNLRINGNGRPIRGSTDLYLGRDDYLTLEIYYVDATTGWNIRYGQDVLAEFELGDASVKNVGTNFGDVMGVGAFGIGGGINTATRVDQLWPSNNLNDIDRTGFYTNANGTNGPDNDTAGMVFHFQRALTTGTNSYQQYVSGKGIYFRQKSSAGVWGAWKYLGGSILALTGTDLNTVTDNGAYFLISGNTNVPVDTGSTAFLVVRTSPVATGTTVQEFTLTTGTRYRKWVRRQQGGVWGAWLREVSEDQSEYLPKARPTIRLNFVNGSMDSRLTFARNSVGTYIDADGIIKTAAANVPRIQYEPVTGEKQGLLVEGARTQLLANSRAVSHPNSQTVSGSYTLAKPIADSTPTMVVGSTATGQTGYMAVACGGANLPGGRTTASVFVRKSHADVKGVMLQVADTLTTDSKFANVYFEFDTMKVTRADGSPTNLNTYVRKYRNGWYRFGFSWNSLAGPVGNVFLVYPYNIVNGNNVLMEVGNYRGLALFAVDCFQVEAGEGMSSPINTTNATITRQADIVTMPVTNWNQSGGTIHFVGSDMGGQDTSNSRLYRFTDGTSQNNIHVTKTAAANSRAYATASIIGGGRTVNASTPAALFDSRVSSVLSYGDAEGSGLGSQGSWAAFNNPSLPTAINKLCIGSDGSAQCFFGTVAALYYYPVNVNRDIVENTSEV